MSTLVARYPLLPLSMSSVQRGPRRLSARIQEKGHAEPPQGVAQSDGRANGVIHNQKRKMSKCAKPEQYWININAYSDYDEDDDGFLFKRVKKQKPQVTAARTISPRVNHDASQIAANRDTVHSGHALEIPAPDGDGVGGIKKRRNKMSFSTPKIVGEKAVRRSKRLSQENSGRDGSPKPKGRRKDSVAEKSSELQPQTQAPSPQKKSDALPATAIEATDDHSATKISLPFADTPVIRRNKAMREGKSGKGERRSSLGLRGRRASSLIETGNSNALPHPEVEVQDFYRHIESETLPEPKRMRQLLTWCATRAMGDKPTGTGYEEISVKQAGKTRKPGLAGEC